MADGARAAADSGREAGAAPAPGAIGRAPKAAGATADLRRLQRMAGNAAIERAVRSEVSRGGRPLEPALREQLERGFGADLGSVRLHSDQGAAASARQVNARAYAYGEHIVIGDPVGDDWEGKRLIAHELVHVLQQRRGGSQAPSPAPRSSRERQAEAIAGDVLAGRRAASASGTAPGLARAHSKADIEALSDSDLASEHMTLQVWLQKHQVGETDYAENLEYFQNLEAVVMSRSPDALLAAPTSATPPAPETAGAPPLGGGPGAPPSAGPQSQQLAAVAAEDMVDFVVNQRAFSANRPGTLNAPGEPLGTGYSVNSMVQVVDAEGNQVAVELGQYAGGGGAHAEGQAVGALTRRLQGLSVRGGKLIVAVDQAPCPT